MRYFSILFFSLFLFQSGISQIRFDVSKLKVTEVPKITKESSADVQYLQMHFGDHELHESAADKKKFENRIVKKVQYVYTDYPKDFDYTELNFQRFAALYVIMPDVFNKAWVEWEIVKQTSCANASEAAGMFHGFIITYKSGPAPNSTVAIPKDVLKKLEKINSSVEFFDIKSAEDLSKFLLPKEMKIKDLKYPEKSASIKLFRQKDPGLSIVNGLFLCTGTPQGAIGPNNSPSVSSVNKQGITPDKNLSSLVGNSGSLFDAAIIEFDIQIDADSLVFRYAFASEEYPEFLEYNDVFGLFISGIGLNDKNKDTTYNLATLPDKKTPVSVSAINHLQNKEYYIANGYVDTDLKLFKTWQYDGFTKVLTAKIKVKPNQKYHIKFAIADYADPYYDSAIFIDAFGIHSPKALH